MIPAIGLTLQVRVPAEATGGMLESIETTNAPGHGPPLHRHPQTEIFYVLEGRYLVEIDGERLIAEQGDVVAVPGGAAHRFVNLMDTPSRQFIQIMPALDAAAFFTGLGEVMQHGMPDPERLKEFGERWQVEFLGPPLMRDG